MNAYKLITNIPGNRKISLHVPADIPVGPVEIILDYQSPTIFRQLKQKLVK